MHMVVGELLNFRYGVIFCLGMFTIFDNLTLIEHGAGFRSGRNIAHLS